jgi:phosphatidylglycerol:prolipoprotein diacylglycerol transferase
MAWTHNLDPVAFQLGALPVHWYGLMYGLGYVLAVVLALRRWRHARLQVSRAAVLDLLFLAMLGVILGARLGHMLFYDFAAWRADPWAVVRMHEGGMSFHGGALGVCAAICAWSRWQRVAPGDAFDFIVPLAPLGIACGRIGNFINGELWGLPSTLPWAMIFPQSGDAVPRHPNQLYEALGEGVLLFVLLWWYSARARPRWSVSALFLLGYGMARFTLEWLRAPAADPTWTWTGLTRAQLLTLPMLLAGVTMLWSLHRSAHASLRTSS